MNADHGAGVTCIHCNERWRLKSLNDTFLASSFIFESQTISSSPKSWICFLSGAILRLQIMFWIGTSRSLLKVFFNNSKMHSLSSIEMLTKAKLHFLQKSIKMQFHHGQKEWGKKKVRDRERRLVMNGFKRKYKVFLLWNSLHTWDDWWTVLN